MFRAYDPQRERLVAVKLFTLDLPPERVHRLVSEFERLIAADLTHSAIASPLATGITGVSAFLAQDYVAAESLDLSVREYGQAAPADALRVAAQLAAALDFASVVNISHGALHPRDVLLSSDETRLTGVGVAHALEQVGVLAPVRRPYSAPERIAGAGWDRRADVFSLAAVIHELLWARRVSGTGSQAAEALTDIEGGDRDALRATFARALADDPLARFETALEFAEALKHAFPAIAIAGPSSTTGRPSKRARRSADPEPQTADRGLQTPTESEPRLPLEAVEAVPSPKPERAKAVLAGARVARPNPDGAQEMDLPISPAVDEASRFRDIESVPAIVDRDVSAYASPVTVPAGLITGHDPEPLEVLAEQSRSAVWPLMLALTIGLAMGFGGGYWAGTRERAAPAAVPAVAAVASRAAAAPVAPTGREFTESAVSEPAKPAGASAPPVHTPLPPPKSEVGTPKPEAGRLKSERETPAQRPAPNARARTPITESRGGRSTTPVAAPAPVATTGGFTVESRPTGAKVYLDNTFVGTTPLSLPSVRAGDHSVRIERDGYRRWATSIKVVAAENNRVTASLER